MINLIEGKINIGWENILAVSDQKLNVLAKEGLIEKREVGGGKIYYYVETVVDDMRFGVFIRLRENRVEWLRLHCLDSPMKGWDDVSEKAVKDEYRLLSDFVEKTVGVPSDNEKSRKRTWRFRWGQIEVCYDLRAFQADIFMKPR